MQTTRSYEGDSPHAVKTFACPIFAAYSSSSTNEEPRWQVKNIVNRNKAMALPTLRKTALQLVKTRERSNERSLPVPELANRVDPNHPTRW
jgi:hypothetical protein